MSVSLKNAMILWNDADEHDGPLGWPRVVAVNIRDSRKIHLFGHLSNSVGACFAGWDSCRAVDRAGYILALFNMLTTKGQLPADEVNKAFLEIEEYAEFQCRDASEDSRYSNPFWQFHWNWNDLANAA